jgi:hypothetical protein
VYGGCKDRHLAYQASCVTAAKYLKKLAPRAGLEPATIRLTVEPTTMKDAGPRTAVETIAAKWASEGSAMGPLIKRN